MVGICAHSFAPPIAILDNGPEQDTDRHVLIDLIHEQLVPFKSAFYYLFWQIPERSCLPTWCAFWPSRLCRVSRRTCACQQSTALSRGDLMLVVAHLLLSCNIWALFVFKRYAYGVSLAGRLSTIYYELVSIISISKLPSDHLCWSPCWARKFDSLRSNPLIPTSSHARILTRTKARLRLLIDPYLD
jgi:hypothetical protein